MRIRGFAPLGVKTTAGRWGDVVRELEVLSALRHEQTWERHFCGAHFASLKLAGELRGFRLHL
ncbi:hypothetical protein SAMN05880582_102341 [Rhizobium sp. RU20A]|nr:hypothetical protein SAMN05880582_102341 [Rhizobium sp. RU20A]